MHLVLGQALERYGTASGVSAWGWAGTQGLRALASWVYLCHLSPQQRRSGLGRGVQRSWMGYSSYSQEVTLSLAPRRPHT